MVTAPPNERISGNQYWPYCQPVTSLIQVCTGPETSSIPVYVYAMMYAGMAIGNNKAQSKIREPGNLYMVFNQAGTMPRMADTTPTPIINRNELTT